MTFGFQAPHIHEVTDIVANSEGFTLGPECINAGHHVTLLSLTFIGEAGQRVTMNVFFDEGFAGRAHDIAEAINASKAKLNQAAE